MTQMYSDIDKKLMSRYIFGSDNRPEDLLSSKIIHRDNSAPFIMGGMQEFMSSGPGRFALPSKSPLVQELFVNGRSLLTDTERAELNFGESVTLSKQEIAMRLSGYFGLDINQILYTDDTDDYIERSWIWQTSAFETTDFTFTFSPDGKDFFSNLGIRLRPIENFDFDGGWISDLVNPHLEPRFDPAGIGVKVNLALTGDVVGSRYDYDDYISDTLREVYEMSGPDLGKLLSEGVDYVLGFWNDGITKTLDIAQRPIIYSSHQGSTIVASDAKGKYQYLIDSESIDATGVAMVGSDLDDIFIIDMAGSAAFGHDGSDTFNITAKNVIAWGGAGQNIFNLKSGSDGSTIASGEGSDVINLEGDVSSAHIIMSGGIDTLDIKIDNLSPSSPRNLFLSFGGAPGEDDLYELYKDRVINDAGYGEIFVEIYGASHTLKINGITVQNLSYGLTGVFETVEDDGARFEYGFADEHFIFGFVEQNVLRIYDTNGNWLVSLHSFQVGAFGLFVEGNGPETRIVDGNGHLLFEGPDVKLDSWYVPSLPGADPDDDNPPQGILFRGSDQAEIIAGTEGNDEIYAGDGNDTIIGGHGKGFDFYHGGEGIDLITFSSATSSITVNLHEGYATGADIDTDRLVSIENVLAGAGDDIITGDGKNNELNGAYGNDHIFGLSGDDVLIGGAGDDILEGGIGNDTYIYNRGDGHDTIVEGALEGDGDVLQINGVNAYTQTVLSASGKDLLIEIDPSSPGAGDEGSILIKDFLNMAGDYGVEIIIDGASNTFTKADVFQFLYGNSDGGLTIWTGSDDDTLIGTAQDDVFHSGAGNDYLFGGAGDDTLVAYAGDDVLEGGAGNDWLVGGAGNDTYIYNRGDGDDTIVEGALEGDGDVLQINGVNAYTQTVLSASGKDLLIEIDPSSPGAGNEGSILIKDFLNMAGDYGVETIIDGASNTFTKADVFQFLYGNNDGGLTIWTGSDDDTLIGTAQDDVFHSGAGDDYLFGGAGDDTLVADAGDDVLEGGAGDDWLVGGTGADTFIFRAGSGEDGIGDFEVGIDTIELHDQGALDFASLMANAEEWGGNAWLNLDDGDLIILYGVGLTDLSASDFRFM